MVEQIGQEQDGLIVAMEVMPDHVHLFLNGLPSLWTRFFFVSTAGNVSSETVKRYVEEQKTRW